MTDEETCYEFGDIQYEIEIKEPCFVPDWISLEVKATWIAMQGAGQMEAYRIMERMARRLGYGDLRDPSLVSMEDWRKTYVAIDY